MTVDSVKKEVDITLIEMDELMGALMYRGGLVKLPYCPRLRRLRDSVSTATTRRFTTGAVGQLL